MIPQVPNSSTKHDSAVALTTGKMIPSCPNSSTIFLEGGGEGGGGVVGITNTYKNKIIYPIIWKFNSQFENCNNYYI